MPKVDLMNQAGSRVAELTLSDYVFGIEPHQQALYEVVNAQRAAMRQGTHDVKNRGEVSGGGRKPWRQKGTGRARQGSIRSAQWRGGGIVFGPTPRAYGVKINKKVRQLALRSAFSHHVKEGKLLVVDQLQFEEAKTKLFANMLKELQIEGKTLFVVKTFDDATIRAARNIPYVSFAQVDHVSVYDMLNCRNLVLTKDAVESIEEALGNE
jgi:large subunit ribosomal protein L4